MNGLAIDGSSQVTISGDKLVRVFLVNGGFLTLENLMVKDGYVASFSGGGIFNDTGGTVTITNSTLSGNSTGNFGGGIANGGTVKITNSTLSGNSGNGGGIFNSGLGTVTIINSTLSGNSAGTGGGIDNRGTVTITNNIVANSPMSGNCDNAGIFTANGNNLDTDGTCPGFGQVTSAQLNLGPLFFNGGPTKTHALLPGSFAIDAGVQTECTADGITTDQRGVPRDAHCDIGSFEFVPPPPSAQGDLSIAKSAAKTAQTGRQLTYTITVKNNGPDSASGVVVKDVLPAGTSFVSVSAPGATSCLMPAPGFTGTVSCSYGSLNNGSSIAPLTLIVKVTAKGNAQLNNTATVSSTTFDPNTANNSATATSKLGK